MYSYNFRGNISRWDGSWKNFGNGWTGKYLSLLVPLIFSPLFLQILANQGNPLDVSTAADTDTATDTAKKIAKKAKETAAKKAKEIAATSR